MSIAPITTLGTVQSYVQEQRALTLDCGGPKVAITIVTPHIIRVRLAPNGVFAPRRSWDVTLPEEDISDVSFDEEALSTVQEDDQTIILQANPVMTCEDTGVAVHIERHSGRISFCDTNGHTFCRDETALQWRESDPHTSLDTWGVAATKHIEAGEHFFGFGQRTGLLEKRGQRMVNWTTDPGSRQGPGHDPLYIAIPIALIVRPGLSYGVFFHNTWHSCFDIDSHRSGVWRMEADGGELDYYVLYGPTPANVLANIGKLLGTIPLPPRWSLGYHQSRWSYAPERVVRDLAAEFRNRAMPCDSIHFDIAYMDGYRVFTWDTERFPNPSGLLSDLRESGFHPVTIIDPGVKVDEGFEMYRQGLERDMFIRRADGGVFHGYVWPDEAVFCDYIRPEVRQWWGDWQKRLVDQGVEGIWNDMNEPTSFHQPFSQQVKKRTWGTLDMDARQGPPDEQTTHAEVHNLFGLNMARASYEGLRRHMDDRRPFVLTRSAFAGIQRWGACWMGDNGSWWEHLEMTMPQLLNMGLSGVPFVGVDIGGFAHNASGELFARWMQLGALSPFCRGHTTHFSAPHEPWTFGEEVEHICRRYLNLRYRLLPYLYTLFWEASQHGAPVLRPLLYHFPDDPATYALHDQVMCGSFLMAAPVYQPGRTCRSVYLPAGRWYDWWTDAVYEGPTHILAQAPLDTMPLYVLAGAIIPSGPEIHYTDEQPLAPLTFDLYPGEGIFTLYEDDGRTFEYERGDFCITRYRLGYEEQGGDGPPALLFESSERVGGHQPPDREIILRVHAVGAAAAAAHPDAHYDVERCVLTLAFEDDGNPLSLRFVG